MPARPVYGNLGPMQRILVIDDDRVTRHLVRGLLAAEGFAVELAGDADEARRKMARTPFALLIVDVWMPGTNGLDFLAQLRERGETPRALILTADVAPETLLRAVSAQAYRCLHKPVDPKTLVEVVNQSLESPPAAGSIQVLSSKPEWVELLVPCDAEAAERLRSFMAQLDADLPEDVRESVGSAFQEMLRNAIEWGGNLNPQAQVRIACIRTPRMILYRIADPGGGFRFDELRHAALNNPAGKPLQHVEEREKLGIRPGGYGIVLTRALVDELLFNETQNEVLFVKYLEDRPGAQESD